MAGTQRRSSSRNRGGAGAGEGAPGTHQDEQKGRSKSKIGAKANNIDVEAMYTQATNGFYYERQHYLRDLEQEGYLESFLWPNLVKSKNLEDGDKETSQKLAFVMALLVNTKVSATGSPSPLDFLNHSLVEGGEKEVGEYSSDSETQQAFDKWLSLVVALDFVDVSDDDENAKNARYDLQSSKVQFLSHCLSSLDVPVVQQAVITLVNSPLLLNSLSERKREYEFAKSPLLKQEWESFEKNTATLSPSGGNEQKSTNSTILINHAAIYIPRLISQLLQAVQSPSCLTEEIQDTADDEGEGKEIEEEAPEEGHSGPSPHYDKEQHRILNFIHHTMEFFTDLLLCPSTRGPHLKLYLDYSQLVVHCALSPLWRASKHHFQRRTKNPDLFGQLLDMLIQAIQFAVRDDSTVVVDKDSTQQSNAQIDAINISSQTLQLSEKDVMMRVHAKCSILQKMAYRYFPETMTEFAFAGVHMACQTDFLQRHLSKLSTAELWTLAYKLRVVSTKLNEKLSDEDQDHEDEDERERQFILALLVYAHAAQPSQSAALRQMPVYPVETLLWDSHVVPPGNVSLSGNQVLALPKLNLQFLTIGDYLLRSFMLVRLESAYEIRSDLVDAIKRLAPMARNQYEDDEYNDPSVTEVAQRGGDHSSAFDETALKRAMMDKEHTVLKGWARMAMELQSFRFIKVGSPNLGEVVPSVVTAELVIDLKPLGFKIRQEWDALREHDVLFGVAISASHMTGEPVRERSCVVPNPVLLIYLFPTFSHPFDGFDPPPPPPYVSTHQAPFMEGMKDHTGAPKRVPDDEDSSFPQRFGVQFVRGCMVLEMRDEAGTLMNDPTAQHQRQGGVSGTQQPQGMKRFIKVALDPAQFASDASHGGRTHRLGTHLYQVNIRLSLIQPM
jgi:hypothetical protein